MLIVDLLKFVLKKEIKLVDLIRKSVERLNEYVPGEQPLDKNFIKLNTNENPYLPSPDVLDILSMIEISNLNKYPDPNSTELKKTIAELHNCSADEVFIGNGSDEILSLSVKAFVENNEIIGFFNPSYSLYSVLSDIENIRYELINLDDNFEFDGQFEKDIKLLLIANPNAPTGISLTSDIILNIVNNHNGVLIIDEAYADFADKNYIHLALDRENCLVTRSLSKSYSLAGIRCGYCIGNKKLISALNKIKDSYNINYITQEIARVAVLDQRTMKANVQAINETKIILKNKLKEFGFKVFDSDANFLWTKPLGISANKLYESLKMRNILVRYFKDNPKTSDYLRITIGTAPEIFKLIDTIDDILGNEE